MNKIAEQYKRWMKSPPFDIGTTTTGGLRPLETMDKPTQKKSSDEAYKRNRGSYSNGSLMRCTPMAIFTAKLSDENKRELIESDVAMTHPN